MRASLGIIVLLFGCYGTPATRELPSSHPGSPEATATAFEQEPDPFGTTPTYSLPPAPSSEHGMRHAPGLPGMGQESGEKKAEETGPEPEYRCPMHPDVVRSTPGTCPECGMELRAVQPAQEHENGER